MALRIAYIALWGILCLPGISQAKKPLHAQANLNFSKPKARSAWPTSPCKGKEKIVWSQRSLPADTIAEAYVELCRVVVGNHMRYTTRTEFCNVLTHEFGHLAGYDHVGEGWFADTNPLSTMTADTQTNWVGCR